MNYISGSLNTLQNNNNLESTRSNRNIGMNNTRTNKSTNQSNSFNNETRDLFMYKFTDSNTPSIPSADEKKAGSNLSSTSNTSVTLPSSQNPPPFNPFPHGNSPGPFIDMPDDTVSAKEDVKEFLARMKGIKFDRLPPATVTLDFIPEIDESIIPVGSSTPTEPELLDKGKKSKFADLFTNTPGPTFPDPVPSFSHIDPNTPLDENDGFPPKDRNGKPIDSEPPFVLW